MILVVAYLLVSITYFWREKDQALDPVSVAAVALGAGYIGIYLLAGPTPQLGGRAAGKRGQIYFPLRSNEP